MVLLEQLIFEDLHMLFALDTENQRAIQTGLIFISCAFLFKMAASPFHVWSRMYTMVLR